MRMWAMERGRMAAKVGAHAVAFVAAAGDGITRREGCWLFSQANTHLPTLDLDCQIWNMGCSKFYLGPNPHMPIMLGSFSTPNTKKVFLGYWGQICLCCWRLKKSTLQKKKAKVTK